MSPAQLFMATWAVTFPANVSDRPLAAIRERQLRSHDSHFQTTFQCVGHPGWFASNPLRNMTSFALRTVSVSGAEVLGSFAPSPL